MSFLLPDERPSIIVTVPTIKIKYRLIIYRLHQDQHLTHRHEALVRRGQCLVITHIARENHYRHTGKTGVILWTAHHRTTCHICPTRKARPSLNILFEVIPPLLIKKPVFAGKFLTTSIKNPDTCSPKASRDC